MPEKNPKLSKRAFKKIRTGYNKLENKATVHIRAQVEKFRIGIAEKLASSDWNLQNMEKIKMIVNDTTLEFQRLSLAGLDVDLEKAFIKGIKQVDDVLLASNQMVIMPYLSKDVLEVSQSMARELITGLSTEMANRVNTQVRMALMGGQTPYQTMKNLETFIPPLRSKKYVGSVRARAENIVRTEMGRVNSMANKERMEMVTEINPDYGKKWLGTHKPTSRPAHMAQEELGVVPMDYEYDVNGYKCSGPHDPRLPASEVCQCGCTLILDKLPEKQAA